MSEWHDVIVIQYTSHHHKHIIGNVRISRIKMLPITHTHAVTSLLLLHNVKAMSMNKDIPPKPYSHLHSRATHVGGCRLKRPMRRERW